MLIQLARPKISVSTSRKIGNAHALSRKVRSRSAGESGAGTAQRGTWSAIGAAGDDCTKN